MYNGSSGVAGNSTTSRNAYGKSWRTKNYPAFSFPRRCGIIDKPDIPIAGVSRYI
jgi:hypothetical protein